MKFMFFLCSFYFCSCIEKCDFVGETKKDFELLDNSDILNTHIANYHGKKLMEEKAQRIKENSYH